MREVREVQGCVSFVIMAVLIVPRPAQAQQQGDVYVTAGVVLPMQQGATDGPRASIAAPGGVAAGGMIGAGVYFSRLVSVEGQVSRTRLFEAEEFIQILNYTSSERRRENLIETLVRVHLPTGRRLQAEPVAGLAISIPQTTYQVTSSGAVQPKFDHHTPILVGISMGFDARLGNERLAIVPSFRVRVTSGAPKEIDPRGFPRWTITPGVSARLGF